MKMNVHGGHNCQQNVQYFLFVFKKLKNAPFREHFQLIYKIKF